MALSLRSINTELWDDEWIETLTPHEKLLWLNFLTNKKSNLLGIFKVSVRRAAFETGLSNDEVANGWRRFIADGKVVFIDGYVIFRNFLKNQRYNPNMKKAVISIFNSLPNSVRGFSEILHKNNIEKAMTLIHNSIENHFTGKTNHSETIPNHSQRTKEERSIEERSIEEKKDNFSEPFRNHSEPFRNDNAEEEKEDSLFFLFLKIYKDFYKKKSGFEYKETSNEDKALQEIINYFEKIAKDTTFKSIDIFQTMLDNFDHWDSFHQKQLLISEISKNIPNILNTLQNGKKNSKTKKWSEDIEAVRSIINEV